jgi:nitrite reductase/ring-hydroxylating ferredoxin subunit
VRGATLFGRRDLLARGGLLALAAATVATLFTGLRNLWPRAGKAAGLLVPAGRPEEYAVGQVSERLLAEHDLWVLRTGEGFHAFSVRCTHLGCRLRWVGGSSQFRCMCHGSFFSRDGEVLRGPAARPMERVYLALGDDGVLRADPGVRYRRERGEWALPGAFVAYRARKGRPG